MRVPPPFLQVYDRLFQFADTDRDGRVTGKVWGCASTSGSCLLIAVY